MSEAVVIGADSDEAILEAASCLPRQREPATGSALHHVELRLSNECYRDAYVARGSFTCR